MARGTTLANLRAFLKAEIGDFSGTNTARDSEVNVLLSNKQKWLASEYDFPFLQHFWDATCPAGTQYVNLPTTTADTGATNTAINFERPVIVERFYNNIYDEIEYGIGRDEYNTSNFATLSNQLDPIQRYRLVTDTSEASRADQFEVWPVPVTSQVVRFTGQRALNTLAADGDKADLDDMLLVYFVAAEILLREKQSDAQAKMVLAQQRLQKVRSVYPERDRTVVLGGSDRDFRKERRLAPLVIVH